MKRFTLTAVFALSLGWAWCNETLATIKVSEATVYLKGAKVTGSSQVKLNKGKNFVRIQDLPMDINVHTLNVKFPKNVDMMSITPQRQVFKASDPHPDQDKFNKEKDGFNNEIALIDIRIRTLQAEKGIIDNNKQIVAHDKLSNIEQLKQLTEFYAKKILEIDTQIFNLSQQKNKLQQKINDINTRLNELKPKQKTFGYDVVLELDSPLEQTAEITLSYLVDNAGWIPSYDVRAQTAKKAVELTYKGKIYQNTGQDWNNIKLSVSSYRPNLNTQRPILHAMYVMEFQPEVYRPVPMSDAQGRVSNTYQTISAKEVQSYNDSEIQFAEPAAWLATSESHLSAIYELNKKHSIASSNEAQHVLLDKRDVDADYVYHAVPAITQEVHLLAKIKNWNTLNLMGGEAFLFLGDNFVGKTVINSQYANDEFPIALGTDERIVVKRTRLQDESKTKKNGKDEIGVHSYEIVYKNNLSFDITLEILDQLPITQDERIQITDGSFGKAEHNATTGALLWTYQVAAGKSGKFTFGYTISHPKGLKIMFKRK